jgi:hypothetical protein
VARYARRADTAGMWRQRCQRLKREERVAVRVIQELARRVRAAEWARQGLEAEVERLSVRVVSYAAMLTIAPEIALGREPAS